MNLGTVGVVATIEMAKRHLQNNIEAITMLLCNISAS